ncbi:MAG: HIT domain-containing protein [Actinobacteria bacterium]|nr:HIT domain-containing protein [Actinomycetota bacterium]
MLGRLWSPWRSEYIAKADSDDGGCIFCDNLAADDDDATGILSRSDRVFVMLNAYPYNSGHVMVAPNRHAGELGDLDPAERAALMDMTSRSVEVIRAALTPDGFNIGINLGRVAGAGVPGHVHVHVVPRWGGDTNFMPVVGQTKVLPEMLTETEAKLRPGFTA